MKTTTLIISLLFVLYSSAQTAKLTSSNLKNYYEIKFENNPKEETIQISITDSEKNSIAHKLTEKDNTPISFINNNIAKTINKISTNYHYIIPGTKVVINLQKDIKDMSLNDFNTEIKKTERKNDFITLLKSVTFLDTKGKHINYETFLKEIKNNEPYTIFNNPSIDYKIKKIDDNSYSLVSNDIEEPIDSKNEDGFYGVLYEKVKDNDTVIHEFFSDQMFSNFQNTTLLTEENTKELEKAYNTMKGEDKIADYNYMGYIGTNFDLIEGIKAKNVFFAINVLSKPKKDRDKIGFYISLYGNRTLSKNDSIKNITHSYRVFDSIVDNQTQKYSQRQQYNFSKTVNNDNLGAYFSPLIKVWSLSNLDGATQLFVCPSLEFIWRRVSVVNRISNIRNERPFLVSGTTENFTNPINTNLKSYQFNSYDFNMGGGFWMIHENTKISVRLNMNVGWLRSFAPDMEKALDIESFELNNDYLKTGDIFYTGKLWITESSTGITLQAEILNTLDKPNPFYGVTLSKAFDFEKLGNFFKPITSR
jgi:hypothetical protein